MADAWTKTCPVCKGLMHEKNKYCSAACAKQANGVNIDEPISRIVKTEE